MLKLTLESMDRYNIVLGFLNDDPFENVQQWAESAPKRFILSAGFFDPTRADLGRLRELNKAGRLRGIGELANQYSGIAANDVRMEPLFALAEELDLPVLIHSEGLAGPSKAFRIAHGRPELLEEVLIRHPRLRLYLENAGYPFFDSTLSLMYRYPNVYADVSTITWLIPRAEFHRYLRRLVDAGLGKRLMFGSDQMEWPEAIGLAIEGIESAEFLTLEQKRDIFYNNAARFLRLEERKPTSAQ